jgi:ATP-dependent RNA helicase DeaD
VEDIELVLHDESAADVDTYIHRIGRTGRAGRSGRSILFLPPSGMRRLQSIQRVAGKLERYEVPTDTAMARAEAQRVLSDLATAEIGAQAKAVLAEAESSGMDLREVALRALQRLVVPVQSLAAAEAPSSEPGATIGLSLKVGAVDGVRPGDIMGMLVHEGALPAASVGRIDILPHISVVEVPEAEATRLVGSLHRSQYKGRRLLPRLAEDWKFKTNRR